MANKHSMKENVMYSKNNKKIYYSNIVEGPILDAITGARYPYQVSSFDEKRFFKVRSTIAYRNPKGQFQEGYANASNTCSAFYLSPEAYMEYNMVKLPVEVVRDWHNRVDKLQTVI